MEASIGMPILAVSFLLGALFVFAFFSHYFRRRRSELQTGLLPPSPPLKPAKKPPPPTRTHGKPHLRHTDKDQIKQHHPLEVNTLKGHGDSILGLCFSSDGRSLATACADEIVRVFKVDDASTKNYKFLRLNLPAGNQPVGVAFLDDAASIVVAAQALFGSSLYLYGEGPTKEVNILKQRPQKSFPEIVWEHHKVHDDRNIITLSDSVATYGTAKGNTIIASCSEGTDIKIWHGKSGELLGVVDTNQLKNTMAVLSPNGRFLAAAAFTADVKVWEILYAKDGSVREVSKVMQLKGHKSAVTCLCFTANSEQIITVSKDETIRIWNINVRYHLDEDPKTIKVFQIPLRDVNGSALYYEHISVSPDGNFLCATHASTLQWLRTENGEVVDTAGKAHDGNITWIAWTPKKIPLEGEPASILATAGTDKRVKFWKAPQL